MGVIYKTTNLLNGKIYIGKRIFDKEKFLRCGYYGSGTLLKSSIKKYGLENFVKIIIEEIDNELLSEREIYWIKYFNSNNLEIGYNLTIGGNSKYGRKCKSMSDETKQKLRESTINQFREKGHPFQNKHHSEETKDKIRMKLKGVKQDDERIKKASLARTGMKYNIKHIKKVKPPKIYQNIEIKQMTMNGEFIRNWNSIMDAAKYHNIGRSGISRACSGLYKQCGGYKWEYINK